MQGGFPTWQQFPPDEPDTFIKVPIIQECASTSEFQEVEVPSSSSDDIFYLVTLPPWDRVESEIVCECPSYEFRGRCRHQREALLMVCSWCELDGKPQTTDERRKRICPECGSRTQIVMIGEE